MYAQWGNTVGTLLTVSGIGNFAGWYTSPTDGTQVTSTDVVTSNITLYARFLQTGIYDITYNANGGLYAPAPQRKVVNASTPLTTSLFPIKKGYVFLGWSTNQAATRATYFRANNQSAYNTNFTTNANTTLYAIWGKRGDVDLDGVVNISDANQILMYLGNMESSIITKNQ